MATKSKPAPDPILDEGPTITIEGHTYKIRRLGLQDVFRVVRILGNGISVLVGSGQFDPKTTKAKVDPGLVVQVLIASVQRHQEDLMELIADLLSVEREKLDDPERFPMTSILDLYETLANHQDLLDFLSRVETLMGRLPELQAQANETTETP